MLWLILAVLLIAIIAGGVWVAHPILWALVIVALIAFFAPRYPRGGPPV